MKYTDRNKHKAFLGALIGSVVGLGTSIAGSVINNKKQKKAQEEAEFEQERAEEYKNALGSANALNESIEGQRNYQNAFRNQYYRLGGRCKKKCGGKTKADLGTEIASAISNASGGIGTLATSITDNSSAGQIASAVGNFVQGTIAARNKEKLADRQITTNDNNTIDTLLAMRYGGRKKCRCGGKKK